MNKPNHSTYLYTKVTQKYRDLFHAALRATGQSQKDVLIEAANAVIAEADKIPRPYFWQQVAWRRMRIGLTQNHVAREAGLLLAEYKRYESGEADFLEIGHIRLARLMSVLDLPGREP